MKDSTYVHAYFMLAPSFDKQYTYMYSWSIPALATLFIALLADNEVILSTSSYL